MFCFQNCQIFYGHFQMCFYSILENFGQLFMTLQEFVQTKGYNGYLHSWALQTNPCLALADLKMSMAVKMTDGNEESRILSTRGIKFLQPFFHFNIWFYNSHYFSSLLHCTANLGAISRPRYSIGTPTAFILNSHGLY